MERTVFVFEGEKAERNYFRSLERAFFSDEKDRLLVTFQNDLYELYKQISADEDLDVFELIKELNPIARKDEDLKSLRRDQVGQIYLFFDLEPNDQGFSGRTLLDMLQRFNNETEHGKLFISYPMIEAVRDIDDLDEYLDRVVDLSDCRGAVYKELSSRRGNRMYQDARKIDKQRWQHLIEANLRKANLLIYGNSNVDVVNDQSSIAAAQLNNWSLRDPLSVLSAFPIFLADYFGLDVLQK